jgi:hypothetical protein
MIMKYTSFLLLCFFIIPNAFAQEVKIKKTALYDSLYITKYDKYLTFTPIIDVLSYEFEFASTRNNSNDLSVNYAPNLRPLWGMGFGYRWLYFELSTSKGLESMNDSKKGNTRKLSISGSITKQKWVLTGYLTYFKGMYMTNPETFGQTYLADNNGFYPLRGDLSTLHGRLSGYYIFNNKKFSLAAGMSSESQRQNKSAGSLITGLTFAAVEIQADSSVIPAIIKNSFEQADLLKINRYTLITINGGYSHTFVLKHFYANLGLMLGFGPVVTMTTPEDENLKTKSANLAFVLDSRIALGYNSAKFYTGFNLSNSYINSTASNEASIITSKSNFRIFIGYRIKVNCHVPIIDYF